MVPHTIDTDAVVLDCIDHSESDIIVTLFCRDNGRVTAIAKGAKKSKKRFVNKLELFTFLRVTYQQKNTRSMAFLADAELHTSFLNIRSNLELYIIASVIREFLLIAMRDGEVDIRTFRLCLWALHSLNQTEQPKAVLTLFLIRFFDYIGYRPVLDYCHKCSSPFADHGQYKFDIIGGGLICTKCHTKSHRGLPLSPGTIKMLRSAQDQTLEKLHRLKLSGPLLQESLALLHSYGRQLFQRDITSWKILQKFNYSK